MSVFAIHATSELRDVECGKNSSNCFFFASNSDVKFVPKGQTKRRRQGPEQFIVIIYAYNIRGTEYSATSILMC